MIEQTVEDLTTIIGTRPACRALGAAPATIYRRRRPPAPRPVRSRAASPRALSEPVAQLRTALADRAVLAAGFVIHVISQGGLARS